MAIAGDKVIRIDAVVEYEVDTFTSDYPPFLSPTDRVYADHEGLDVRES